MHQEIARYTNGSEWLSAEFGFLYEEEIIAIRSAKEAIRTRARPLTEDILIAELRFGFWTSLLDSRYELMWHKIIGGVFPNMPRSIRLRREASKLMNTVRRLRNAALHHHSIWHWGDLEDQHKQMHIMIGYICVSISRMVKQLDRFPSVYAAGPDRFADIANALLK